MVRDRLKLLMLLLALPFLAAFGWLAVLQLVPAFHDEAVHESRHLSIRPVPPERGRILDRNGEVLAGNVPTYDVNFEYLRLHPRDRLVELLAAELSETFGEFHDPDRIEAKILELARPEEIDARPRPVDRLERSRSRETEADPASGKEWILLMDSIHKKVRDGIIRRWRVHQWRYEPFFEFRDSERPEYSGLWFSRRDLVRREVVLSRLALQLAGGDPIRAETEYERLLHRVAEVRKRFGVSSLSSRSFILARDVSLDVVTALEYYPESFIGLSTESRALRVYPAGEVLGSLLGQVGLLTQAKEAELRESGFLTELYFGTEGGRGLHDDLDDFTSDRSRIIGLRDRRGLSGLEHFYDEELRGLYGGIQIQSDPRRRTETILAEVPVEDGEDLRTTIDLSLSRVLHEALLRASTGTSDEHGNAASVVVIDVSTGALLACSGVPSIDPNRVRDPDYRKELEERWSGQTTGWHIDRPTSARLAPGSVFKIVLAAAALESAAEIGFSPRDTTYPCRHKFPDFKIHCNARYGHGLDRVDLVQGLKFSCNNYFFSIGYRLLGPGRIASWAQKFGYGAPPGVDIVGGGQGGRIGAVDRIKGVGVCHFSIGQVHVEATCLQLASIGQVHVEATCLQVARSMSVIASGGLLPRPHLVKPTRPAEMIEFRNPETIKLIRAGLWRVVHESDGTAGRTDLNAFRVALKTGTAEVRKSGEILNNAWLAGYAPAGAPGEPEVRARIAFAVVVEETRGHGAEVCAPVVQRILEHFAASDPDAYSLRGSLRSAGD